MRPVSLRTNTRMSAMTAQTISVSQTLIYSMQKNTTVSVNTDDTSWAMDCAIIWRSVSVSFVYRLMMSPCVCVSK